MHASPEPGVPDAGERSPDVLEIDFTKLVQMFKQSHFALALLPCLAACQFSSPTTDADRRPFADVAQSLYAPSAAEDTVGPLAEVAHEHLMLDAASGERATPSGAAAELAVASNEWSGPALPKDDNKVGDSYTKLKLGAFEPTAAFSGFDTGVAAEVALGREFLNFLSVEGSVGYIDCDGPAGSDFYAIPLFVNARAGLPILVFEPYLGVGVGGVYADVSGLGSDFVGAVNGMVGVEFGLGNLAVGVEAKYIATDDIKSTAKLEGTQIAALVSLPF